MLDRHIRNLANLQNSASSSRVLNLLQVHRRHHADVDYSQKPLFRDAILNRAILLKHRLRREERHLFYDGRSTATKVVIPIDKSDLRLGGRSVLVGQHNYDQIMTGTIGDGWMDSQDRQTLTIIDEIPSLDPFLLREHLRRHHRTPARCYFNISDPDADRMFQFVQAEVQRLIELCYVEAQMPSGVDVNRNYAQRLVRKMLSDTVDADTEPLRQTLRLDRREYGEGIFCWKGFLYYKWTLTDTIPAATRLAKAISQARAQGRPRAEVRAYLETTRRSLGHSILAVCGRAKAALQVYDDAFAKLVNGEPAAFRDFLLNAPGMFTELGERLGAVSHVVSFWKYRFPGGQVPDVSPEELMDLFQGFESNLAPVVSKASPAGPADPLEFDDLAYGPAETDASYPSLDVEAA